MESSIVKSNFRQKETAPSQKEMEELMKEAQKDLDNIDPETKSMMGAGHMAMPVLKKLNRVHKYNSTIPNNLGQTWLQLGDAVNANKNLDRAIMR